MVSVSCVLVVGNGGREHALAWTLGRSPHVKRLLVAPGNGGTDLWERTENFPVSSDDISGLVGLCRDEAVDLVVVGPEVPLANGIVDALNAASMSAFGPRTSCAQLEASKAFCKQFLMRNQIPTADARVFRDPNAAVDHIDSLQDVPVVKASGLAAGKGVVVPATKDEAKEAVKIMMVDRQFGVAGDEILVEECLTGREVSVLAFCDGEDFVVLPPAQDYKRLQDGDVGLNTGGMGSIVPAAGVDESLIDDQLMKRIEDTIITPTLDAFRKVGMPYRGLLYAGIMITDEGPKVLEFNCRFGDPETQAVIRLLRSDLFEILHSCATGSLTEVDIEWSSEASVAVVVASEGYPVESSDSVPIAGIDAAVEEGCVIFHAGTKLDDGVIYTNGGRVLAVTAVGSDLTTAADHAHRGVSHIGFKGARHRADIGRTIGGMAV